MHKVEQSSYGGLMVSTDQGLDPMLDNGLQRLTVQDFG